MVRPAWTCWNAITDLHVALMTATLLCAVLMLLSTMHYVQNIGSSNSTFAIDMQQQGYDYDHYAGSCIAIIVLRGVFLLALLCLGVMVRFKSKFQLQNIELFTRSLLSAHSLLADVPQLVQAGIYDSVAPGQTFSIAIIMLAAISTLIPLGSFHKTWKAFEAREAIPPALIVAAMALYNVCCLGLAWAFFVNVRDREDVGKAFHALGHSHKKFVDTNIMFGSFRCLLTAWFVLYIGRKFFGYVRRPKENMLDWNGITSTCLLVFAATAMTCDIPLFIQSVVYTKTLRKLEGLALCNMVVVGLMMISVTIKCIKMLRRWFKENRYLSSNNGERTQRQRRRRLVLTTAMFVVFLVNFVVTWAQYIDIFSAPESSLADALHSAGSSHRRFRDAATVFCTFRTLLLIAISCGFTSVAFKKADGSLDDMGSDKIDECTTGLQVLLGIGAVLVDLPQLAQASMCIGYLGADAAGDVSVAVVVCTSLALVGGLATLTTEVLVPAVKEDDSEARSLALGGSYAAYALVLVLNLSLTAVFYNDRLLDSGTDRVYAQPQNYSYSNRTAFNYTRTAETFGPHIGNQTGLSNQTGVFANDSVDANVFAVFIAFRVLAVVIPMGLGFIEERKDEAGEVYGVAGVTVLAVFATTADIGHLVQAAQYLTTTGYDAIGAGIVVTTSIALLPQTAAVMALMAVALTLKAELSAWLVAAINFSLGWCFYVTLVRDTESEFAAVLHAQGHSHQQFVDATITFLSLQTIFFFGASVVCAIYLYDSDDFDADGIKPAFGINHMLTTVPLAALAAIYTSVAPTIDALPVSIVVICALISGGLGSGAMFWAYQLRKESAVAEKNPIALIFCILLQFIGTGLACCMYFFVSSTESDFATTYGSHGITSGYNHAAFADTATAFIVLRILVTSALTCVYALAMASADWDFDNGKIIPDVDISSTDARSLSYTLWAMMLTSTTICDIPQLVMVSLYMDVVKGSAVAFLTALVALVAILLVSYVSLKPAIAKYLEMTKEGSDTVHGGKGLLLRSLPALLFTASLILNWIFYTEHVVRSHHEQAFSIAGHSHRRFKDVSLGFNCLHSVLAACIGAPWLTQLVSGRIWKNDDEAPWFRSYQWRSRIILGASVILVDVPHAALAVSWIRIVEGSAIPSTIIAITVLCSFVVLCLAATFLYTTAWPANSNVRNLFVVRSRCGVAIFSRHRGSTVHH